MITVLSYLEKMNNISLLQEEFHSQAAVTLIRREQIEPQSPMAFHVFARAVKVMYRIGAALELKRLGYKFEEVALPHHFGRLPEC